MTTTESDVLAYYDYSLNRTLNKVESCINLTLNKVPMKDISVYSEHKLRFGLGRFHCTYKTESKLNGSFEIKLNSQQQLDSVSFLFESFVL